jgi:uncharacterized protein (DUF305 family)
MKVLPIVGSLLLSTAVLAASAPGQAPKPGVIPQGLADGPYVHLMAMHHEEGMKIAGLAAKKASNASITALAARVLSNQQTELAQLRQFMTSVAEDMAPSNKDMMKKMPAEKLETASGAAFDRLFLDMMIEHHQDALSMTRGAKLVMPGVQGFASKATQRLESELKEMQALRKLAS